MKNEIEIVSFDQEKNIINFKYIGDIEKTILVRLSWYNLTIYFDEIKVSNNKDILYFVGSNTLSDELIDFFDITFYYNGNTQTHTFKHKQFIAKVHSLSTEIFELSYYEYKSIFFEKIYYDDEIKINEGDVVVDVGAKYGLFSLYAKEFNPAKLFSLESSTHYFHHLSENVDDSDKYNLTFDSNFFYEGLNSEKIDFLKIENDLNLVEKFDSVSQDLMSKVDKIVIRFHSENEKSKVLENLNRFGFLIKKIKNSLIFARNKKWKKNQNKKKIVLFSTFCDTEKKMKILLENLKITKSLGLQTLIISPNFIPLDEEIIKLSDFVFYTQENPILWWPVRQFTHWYEQLLEDQRVLTMHRGVGDYGWAALYQTKKLFQLGLTFDYDVFYHLIYDVNLDEVLINQLLGDEINVVHPRRDPHHPETTWETTLHFMIFDRDMVQKIEKELTLEQYLSTNGVAEGEVLKWTKKFDINISDHCVQDKIFYWENFDFYNYKISDDFKMFISKNPESEIWVGYQDPKPEKITSNLRIVFYEIPQEFQIQIIVNGKIFDLKPKNFEFIELPIDSLKIENIYFVYRGEKINFSKEYSEISYNQIFYNFY